MTQEDNIIQYLILNNALEVSGIDSNTGQFLYSFTPKIKEIMPELYKDHLKFVNDELMVLWEKGYVNIDLFSPDPIVSLTEKGLNQEEINKLPEQEQWSLDEVKRLLKKPKF